MGVGTLIPVLLWLGGSMCGMDSVAASSLDGRAIHEEDGVCLVAQACESTNPGGDALGALERPTIEPRPARGDSESCFVAARALRAGQIVSRQSLSPAPCEPGARSALIRYDRIHRVVRATSDLAEGEYLGRLDVTYGLASDAGDALVLVVAIGPVRIERQVWAMQPAHDGAALFVRDSDGNIFRAPIEADAAAETAP